MKAIVCVKQVPDTSGKVAVNPDGTLNRASMATEQQHVRLVRLPLFDALYAVFRLEHRVAFALQIQAQQLTDVGLVLYDQYLLGHSSPLLSQFNLILL